MSGTALARTARLASLLAAVAVAACGGGGDKKTGGSDAPAMKSMAVATEDKFKVAAGADPSVPDSLGGSGFEKIAEAGGWKTSTIPSDQLRYLTDTNAKKGGQITFSLQEFPATFRAYGKDENTEATRFIYGMVYESLIGTNPLTYEFLPSLATHWKADADAQTYYYRINPNARFSDGHPVTSEDVLATYKLMTDPGILSPYTNSFAKEFDPPVAVSKYIVKVRSKEKNWKNMLYFGGLSILPAHVIGAIDGKAYLEKYQYEMPPGTGPYVVLSNEVKSGQSITITRRSNWWAKDDPLNRGANNFDKVKILIVGDEGVAYDKFVAGELDFQVISRAQWWKTKYNFDQIKTGVVQKRKVFTDDPAGFGGLAFNTRHAPLDDLRMRRALTMLFNRKQILEKVLYNEYLPLYSYYPNSPYENPRNPHIEYNPEEAGRLLAELGYTQRNSEGYLTKDGKTLEFEMPAQQQLSHVLTPIVEDFKRGGVKLDLRFVDNVTQFKLANSRDFDIIYQQWGGLLFPNPISSFKSDLADQNNTNNITGIKNKRVDEISRLEQTMFDPAQRITLLQELDSILVAENHYALNWYAPFTRIAYWSKFGHPEWYLGKISDWKSIITNWWYDPALAARTKAGEKMEAGASDVKFWPDYNKQHPIQAAPSSFSSQSGTVGDSGAAKPSIR